MYEAPTSSADREAERRYDLFRLFEIICGDSREGINMRRLDWASRLTIVLAAACSLGGGEAFAQAQGLAAAGPVDPGHGFPQFYQDKAGQALEPCLDNSLTTDPCGILAALPNFLQPVVFPTNFPNEFFYWMAVSRIRAAPGNRNLRADLTLALEGAFGGATGAVVPGDQITFARFRFRVTAGLVPNATYTLTYPFGVKAFVASPSGTINFTEDQGCGAVPPACNFASVLPTTNAGPFLRWDATAPAPPTGFIGDPAVDHPVTGSPFGTNIMRIDGPNVGGPGVNTVQTNLFSITGKAFNGVLVTPLMIDRTSFARTAAGSSEIDLFAHSVGSATVTASAAGLPTTTLSKDPVVGRFDAGVNLAPSTSLPAFIRYTATSPGNDPTVRDTPLVDEVTVTTATYSQSGRVLTVNAVSSDQLGAPTLTAAGNPQEPLGTLTGGVLVLPLAAPPFQVTVTSSAGGTGTLLVDLTP